MLIRLSRLPAGRQAVLRECLPERGLRPELERLGLVPGTEIVCLHRLLPGKAAVYGFADTVLALRDASAESLVCEY